MIACSGQGAAPDNVSFAKPKRFSILQHIAASVPSQVECESYDGLSCEGVEELFDKHDFQHVIVCGHSGCRVIRSWLEPVVESRSAVGDFRLRFERGTRDLVDHHYAPVTDGERFRLMICEHVLCQIENLLTHSFVIERVSAQRTRFHGWVVDDETARVYAYSPEDSAFAPI